MYKYSSIENSYRDSRKERCLRSEYRDWVALEKLHGSNFSFVSRAFGDVTPCSRNQEVPMNHLLEYDFNGCHDICVSHFPKINGLRDYLINAELIDETDTFVVYGELTHNKSIDYGEMGFYVFDILLVEKKTWLNFNRVVDACHFTQLKIVPFIERNTLQELLKLDPNFKSILTPLDNTSDNFAEGMVFKPLDDVPYDPESSRLILKHKADAFKERTQKTKKAPVELVLTDEQTQIHMNFSSYLNMNRIESVLSKLNKVRQKDFGKISGMHIQDAKEDYEKDYGVIERDDWNAIKKSLMNISNEILRKEWLNILDR